MFGKKKKLEAERREEELRLQKQELERQQAQAAQKAQVAQQAQRQEDKVFFESELINDDDDNTAAQTVNEDDNALPKEYEAIAYILKQEQGEDLVAEPVDDDKPVQSAQEPQKSVEEVKGEEPAKPAPVLEEVAPAPAEEPEAVEENEKSVDKVEDSDESKEVEEANKEAEPTQDTAPATDEQKEEIVYVVDGPSEDDDEIVKPAKLVKLPNLVDYMLAQNMSKQMKMNIATLLLSAYNKFKDIPAERKIVIQCMAKVMKSLIQG